MKSIPARFLPGIAAVSVAVATCLAAATVVYAQSAPAPRAPGEMRAPAPPGGWKGGHGGPGMRMMREVERLKTSLRLNPQQAAVWDKAVATMKPDGNPREQMKARRDRMTAMLDDPNFDPRKLAAEMDGAEAERRAKMNAVRDAWFAVYDSLNPVQRGQVREFLRERMSHGEHHGMEGRREWHHDEKGGQPPMPPAPPGAPAPR
jgi:Spy/CpxP family protein refolding chaperone